ncbi:hypothetical protein ACFV42_21645 [Streptomyces solisilvae]|uniref:hypothetical protein n=1 Tax=Streptomyces malaysiensis TaxID=92644 RepID=UPI00368A84CA
MTRSPARAQPGPPARTTARAPWRAAEPWTATTEPWTAAAGPATATRPRAATEPGLTTGPGTATEQTAAVA